MENKRKNKHFNPNNCAVTHCLNIIGGKWKILIFHCVNLGVNRFSKLQKAIPEISKQMLVNQLREMEEDGILDRKIFAEIPPKVEYSISEYGKTLIPVITIMQQWGLKDMEIKN